MFKGHGYDGCQKAGPHAPHSSQISHTCNISHISFKVAPIRYQVYTTFRPNIHAKIEIRLSGAKTPIKWNVWSSFFKRTFWWYLSDPLDACLFISDLQLGSQSGSRTEGPGSCHAGFMQTRHMAWNREDGSEMHRWQPQSSQSKIRMKVSIWQEAPMFLIKIRSIGYRFSAGRIPWWPSNSIGIPSMHTYA